MPTSFRGVSLMSGGPGVATEGPRSLSERPGRDGREGRREAEGILLHNSPFCTLVLFFQITAGTRPFISTAALCLTQPKLNVASLLRKHVFTSEAGACIRTWITFIHTCTLYHSIIPQRLSVSSPAPDTSQRSLLQWHQTAVLVKSN